VKIRIIVEGYMQPTMREFKTNRRMYPEWKLCPRCMGDRGEVIKMLNEETGEYVNALRECQLCLGARLIPA
jgi:Zn-finger nucleic acid-binding protein